MDTYLELLKNLKITPNEKKNDLQFKDFRGFNL